MRHVHCIIKWIKGCQKIYWGVLDSRNEVCIWNLCKNQQKTFLFYFFTDYKQRGLQLVAGQVMGRGPHHPCWSHSLPRTPGVADIHVLPGESPPRTCRYSTRTDVYVHASTAYVPTFMYMQVQYTYWRLCTCRYSTHTDVYVHARTDVYWSMQ